MLRKLFVFGLLTFNFQLLTALSAPAQFLGFAAQQTITQQFNITLTNAADQYSISNYGQAAHSITFQLKSPTVPCAFNLEGSEDGQGWTVLATGVSTSNTANQMIYSNGYFSFLRLNVNPATQTCTGLKLVGTYAGYQTPLPISPVLTNYYVPGVASPTAPAPAFLTASIIGSIQCTNPGASAAYLQLFDSATTPTLGTSEIYEVGIAAGQNWNFPSAPYFIATNRLWLGAATAAGGNTAVGTAITCNVQMSLNGPFYPLNPSSAITGPSPPPPPTPAPTPLAVTYGGTGNANLTAHGVLIGANASPIHATSAGTSGQPLLSGGAAADPNWGLLSVANGGTGTATPSLTAGTAIGISGVWPGQTVTNNSAYATLADPLPVNHGGSGSTAPSLTAGTGISISGTWPGQTVTNTSNYATLADPLTVAHGGTGTATPSLIAGTGISISGTWPGQTITNNSDYATVTNPFPVGNTSLVFGGTATKQISGGPESISFQYPFNAWTLGKPGLVWLGAWYNGDFNARTLYDDAGGPGFELGPGGTGPFSDQDTSFRRWDNSLIQLESDLPFRVTTATHTPSGAVSMDVGNYPWADGILTSTGSQPADGDTVTIGAIVYRFKSTMAQAYDVQIGANVQATLNNLKQAVGATGTAGTNYYAGTLANSAAYVQVDYRTDNTTGQVNTNGTSVTWVSGPTFDSFDLPGQKISINGTAYTVSAVADTRDLTLSSSAGTQSNVAYFRLFFHAYAKVRAQDVATGATGATLFWNGNPMPVFPTQLAVNRSASSGTGTVDVLETSLDYPTMRLAQGAASSTVLSTFVEGDAHTRFALTGDASAHFGNGTTPYDTFEITAPGELEWAPGTSAGVDVFQERVGTGQLAIQQSGSPSTTGILAVGRSIPYATLDVQENTGNTIALRTQTLAAADTAFQSSITTDTAARHYFDANGHEYWGPGGAAAQDVDMLRSGVGALKINGSLAITNPLAVLSGGTGTATPSLIAGTGISISGTWPGQTVTATSATVYSVNAKCDGVTDDSAAFTSALAAAQGSNGTYSSPPFFNGPSPASFVLQIPKGECVINTNQVFHLTSKMSGMVIQGTGMYSSVILDTYDANVANNYLIYHDEGAGDGPLQRIVFKDLAFAGPGGAGTHYANFLYDKGTSGTGGISFINVMVTGFQKGWRIDGSAGTDTFSLFYVNVRDVNTVFSLNNAQSAPNTIVAGDICTSTAAGADVFFFDQNAAPAWTLSGGYYCTQSATGDIFHFASNYNGGITNANLTATGVHFELLGGAGSTAQLVYDQSYQASKDLMFVNSNSDVINGTLPRVIANIGTKSNFDWKGGVLGGLINLMSDTSATANLSAAPLLSLTDLRWDQGGGAYTAPTEYISCTAGPTTQGGAGTGCTTTGAKSSIYRPRIYFRNVNLLSSSQAGGFLQDQFTGPPGGAGPPVNQVVTSGQNWTNETPGNTTLTIDKENIANLVVNGDTAFTANPMTVTFIPCPVISTVPVSCAFAQTTKGITILRVDLQLNAAPAGCSTYPIYALGLGNGGPPYSGGNLVQSYTLAAGTTAYTSGPLSVAVAANQITLALNNTPAGCGSRETGVVMSVTYNMQ